MKDQGEKLPPIEADAKERRVIAHMLGSKPRKHEPLSARRRKPSKKRKPKP